MIFWHPHILKEQFRRRPPTHRRHRTRRPTQLTINQEARHTTILWWFRAIGDGKNHRKISFIATRNKNFLPIDNPVVTILNSACANSRRVGACSWLSQRETRLTLPFYSGNEILLFLPFIAMIKDIIGAAAKHKRHQRFPQLHKYQRSHNSAQVCSTILLRSIDTPEAHFFRFPLERVINRWLYTIWIP